MDNIYAASGISALTVVSLLEVVKRSRRIPWLTADTGRLTAWVSAALALLTAVGLVFSFDFDPETGRFAAGLTGNVWDILHVIEHAPVQFLGQHAIYEMGVKPAELLRAILAELKARTPPQTPSGG